MYVKGVILILLYLHIKREGAILIPSQSTPS